MSVGEGAVAPDRAVGPTRRRVVDHPDECAGRVLRGDADREVVELVEIVDRPVQRVDHPADPGPRDAGRALLPQQPVVRSLAGDQFDQQRLGRAVGVRHRIGG